MVRGQLQTGQIGQGGLDKKDLTATRGDVISEESDRQENAATHLIPVGQRVVHREMGDVLERREVGRRG